MPVPGYSSRACNLLEYIEYAVEVAILYSDPVVAHAEYMLVDPLRAAMVITGRVRPPEFN